MEDDDKLERDYVLGTHDEELKRLELQHHVWRRRALDAWLDAGFTSGQTLMDLGCGPGYAALDLAEIAGPIGTVIAMDRSRRFLDALHSNAVQRNRLNIRTLELDLDTDDLPEVQADGIWVRWVFAFVKNPRDLLRRARASLKPGASLVVQEYFDYAAWKLAPRSDVFESFVAAVMKSWRAHGGEPDIGLDLVRWLSDEGFRLRRIRPITEIISPSHFVWRWPTAFVATGVDRLVQLGDLSEEKGREVKDVFARAEAQPDTLMVTPGVIELIADAV